MKKIINAIALSTIVVSYLAFNLPSARANSVLIVPEQSQNTLNINSSDSVNEFMVATVPADLQIDISNNQPQNINLVLAQPFANFPAGSVLRATIHPTEDGNAVILVTAIAGNGTTLKISAESDLLYGQTITISDRSIEAAQGRGELCAVAGTTATALGKDVEDIIQYCAGGGVFGTVIGFFDPQRVQLVNLPAGTPIFLNLK
jgi:hypothetical protein